MTKDELILKAEKLGFENEKAYGGCAQCTLLATLETLSVKAPVIVKAATGFAAGGGKKCDGICGGYAGAISLFGLFFGRREEYMDSDQEAKNLVNEMTRFFREKMLGKYGSLICGEIHQNIFGRKYDLLTPEGFEAFERDGAHTEKCTGVVGFASKTAVQLILDTAETMGWSIEDLQSAAADI